MLKKQIKGFTLIELLAVIVVLGIILTIAIPNIVNIINQARIDACEKQKDLIVDSARKYVLQNGNNITWTSNTASIYLSDLQNSNILPSPLKNPIGGNFDNTSSGINIAVARNGNEYSYVLNNAFCYVDNTPPLITLVGPTSLNINRGSIYEEQGATAFDNIDGDITSKIVITDNIDINVVGTYQVTYNVKDNIGNSAIEVVRTVNIVDGTVPEITMLGNNPETIIVGSVYIDAGATAIDDVDGNLTSNIVVTGTVNPNAVGTYTITYTVSDNAGNEAFAIRTVNVIDNIIPTVAFTINGNTTYAKTRSTTVTISDVGTGVDASSLKYLWNTSTTTPSEASFTTSFTNGGSINSPAGVTGGYYLWILAKDNANNTTIVRTNVFNLDNTAPVITLLGSTPVNINQGTAYTDAGATATDNIDGTITSRITTVNPVNASSPGTYTVTYNVTDNAGNSATQITRTVNVIMTPIDYAYTGSIATFTAPTPGTYKLEVWGAQGGCAYGGMGAKMAGNFALTQGTQLKILVGQQGKCADGGVYYVGATGGGGTFIGKVDNTSSRTMTDGTKITLLIAAGGGGGSNYSPCTTQHASTGTSGTAGWHQYLYRPLTDGGTNGNGATSTDYAGGGGGFLTASGGTYGGKSFLQLGSIVTWTLAGGYGGGGAASYSPGGNYCGGTAGGGGYSGGGSASYCYVIAPVYEFCGGGGGSYNGGTSQSNQSQARNGNGNARITYVVP